MLERGEIAVERAGVGSAVDAGKIRGLIVGPGIGDGTTGRSGVTESVGEMGELVSYTVGLEIGDIVIGSVDGPLLEIAADDFELVVEGGLGEEWSGGNAENKEKTHGDSKTAQFHRTHLGAERVPSRGTVDLYSSDGKGEVCWGNVDFAVVGDI